LWSSRSCILLFLLTNIKHVAIPTVRISTAAAAIVMPAICAIVRDTFMFTTLCGDSEGWLPVLGATLPPAELDVVIVDCVGLVELLELRLFVSTDGDAVTMIVLCVGVTALACTAHIEYSDVPFVLVDWEQLDE
jgi:hypothetical protein